MANTHDIGDTVRVSASFAQNAVAIDPTTVAVVIREPNGAQTRHTYLTDAALVRAATGSLPRLRRDDAWDALAPLGLNRHRQRGQRRPL